MAGFTLIEALIALVVLSVGLLGVAALQMTGLRASMSAASRTQATYLANDILDRMRANNRDARSGLYNLTLGATPSGAGTSLSDMNAWVAELQTLPNGQGSIAVDATTSVATITIQWVDSHGGDTSECTAASNYTNCASLQLTTATQL
ncbi:MAG TPA: type IV pilus modification protein PilV [Steroidobacteraceae bacterium]|jgi:type IV pilus assembly protein PilV